MTTPNDQQHALLMRSMITKTTDDYSLKVVEWDTHPRYFHHCTTVDQRIYNSRLSRLLIPFSINSYCLPFICHFITRYHLSPTIALALQPYITVRQQVLVTDSPGSYLTTRNPCKQHTKPCNAKFISFRSHYCSLEQPAPCHLICHAIAIFSMLEK